MKKTEIFMNKPVCLGLSILVLTKILYEVLYGYYIISLYTYKQIIFIKTLQKMLKLDFIHQIMN